LVIPSFLIIAALFLLALGAEGLVRGSASIALRIGLTPLMIGLTVVAFGTSSPELVVSLKANLSGQGDIAVGNVIGSNILNIGVILGITSIICPVPVKLQIIKIDGPLMILASAIIPLLMFNGVIGRIEGFFLFAGIIGYAWLNIFLARRDVEHEMFKEFSEGVPLKSGKLIYDLIWIIGGLALLVVGSGILVDNCILIARHFRVSEAVIGLTIVAAGTSMPELATSVVAAIKRQPDIAIGNVVGSNIFNVLGILGISSLASPSSAKGISYFDLAVMVGFSILLLPLMWTGLTLRRIEGIVLILFYFAYLYYLWPK